MSLQHQQKGLSRLFLGEQCQLSPKLSDYPLLYNSFLFSVTQLVVNKGCAAIQDTRQIKYLWGIWPGTCTALTGTSCLPQTSLEGIPGDRRQKSQTGAGQRASGNVLTTAVENHHALVLPLTSFSESAPSLQPRAILTAFFSPLNTAFPIGWELIYSNSLGCSNSGNNNSRCSFLK